MKTLADLNVRMDKLRSDLQVLANDAMERCELRVDGEARFERYANDLVREFYAEVLQAIVNDIDRPGYIAHCALYAPTIYDEVRAVLLKHYE